MFDGFLLLDNPHFTVDSHIWAPLGVWHHWRRHQTSSPDSSSEEYLIATIVAPLSEDACSVWILGCASQ